MAYKCTNKEEVSGYIVVDSYITNIQIPAADHIDERFRDRVGYLNNSYI